MTATARVKTQYAISEKNLIPYYKFKPFIYLKVSILMISMILN